MNALDPPATVESLIEQLGRLSDPQTLASAQALVRAVLDMHCAGLARILELAGTASEGSAGLVERFGSDDLISSLLLLHGLHPLSLEARVVAALDRINASGWALKVLAVSEGVVRVSVTRTGDPKRSAAGDRIRALIEHAMDQAAPDAERLVLVGDLDESHAAFVPLDRLRSPGPTAGGGHP